MVSSKKTVLFCLVLVAASAQIARAQDSAMAIGNAGQFHRALHGEYGALLPDGNEHDATTPVLMLEIHHPTNGSSRVVVPGTGDNRVESAPHVLHDARYDSFTVLWSSANAEGISQLRFASFDGEAWSDVHTVEDEGAPVELAGEPLIAVTDDAFELDLGEESTPISLARRTIHVVWRDSGETPNVFYAPLTFLANGYLGWSDPVSLSGTLQTASDGSSAEDETSESGNIEVSETVALTQSLAETLSLRPSDDHHSVLVTFADTQSQRLGTAVITPLRLGVDLLSDIVRDEVFAQAEHYDPENISVFADKLRAGIIITGHRFEFHPAHVDYLAGQIRDWLLESGGSYGWSGFEDLGNDARDRVIDVSSEVTSSLVADPSDPASTIQRLDLSGFLSASDEPQSAQIFNIRLRSNLPAPSVGDGPTTVFSSSDGRDLLVAWEDAEAGLVHWLESNEDASAWTESHSLPISEDLPLVDAHRLLAQKVR